MTALNTPYMAEGGVAVLQAHCVTALSSASRALFVENRG